METSSPTLAPHTVLIVDDVAAVRESLRYAFEDTADLLVVGEAADGLEALARVAELSPHIVILDLYLPLMDGYTVAHRLKALPHPPLIIFLTGRTVAERELFHQADGDGFVEKSAGWVVLLEQVRRALARASSSDGT